MVIAVLWLANSSKQLISKNAWNRKGSCTQTGAVAAGDNIEKRVCGASSSATQMHPIVVDLSRVILNISKQGLNETTVRSSESSILNVSYLRKTSLGH